MKFGYARVSSNEQDFLMQEKALIEAGCEKIFCEKISATIKNRLELDRLMDQIRSNDILVVFAIDRLARSVSDFCRIIDHLNRIDVILVSISNGFDTSTIEGQQMAKAFAWLAEQELVMLKARQKAGQALAKEQGKQTGRPKGLTSIAELKMRECKEKAKDGRPVTETCKLLSINRSTYYRYLKMP